MMQKYVMEGWMVPAEGMGLGVTGRHVYLAEDVDATLTQVRDTGQRIDDKLVKAEKRIAELERQLAFASDAAAKGELARTEAAGMQERIQELEKAPQTLSHARLTWAMACECKCQACAEIDDTLKDLAGQ